MPLPVKDQIYIQYFAKNSNTAYSAVRFGNVLGSNGSVVPIFRRQIEEGGPITVTHPEINRFFMTIPEAVSLILQSGVYAKDGEIFILDMGKPVKIVDLANKMIVQAGLEPELDIKVVFTGLRPGEKLYEELLLDVEHHIKTRNNKIYIEKAEVIFPVKEELDSIKEAFDYKDNEKIKEKLAQIVKSYTRDVRN